MIGDKARLEKMGAPVKTKGFHVPARIRIDENPIDAELNRVGDGVLTVDDLRLRITHRPRLDQPKYAGRDYIVVCSATLKGFNSRYRDWADFCERAERDPVVAFVKKWSTISEDYFEMAKADSGVDFHFGIDWSRYYTHLKKRFEEINGRKPTAADRMFSYKLESEVSAESVQEYQNTIYAESIKRKLSKSKGAKKA